MFLVALEQSRAFSMICILVLHHVSKVYLPLAEKNNLEEIFGFCDTAFYASVTTSLNLLHIPNIFAHP